MSRTTEEKSKISREEKRALRPTAIQATSHHEPHEHPSLRLQALAQSFPLIFLSVLGLSHFQLVQFFTMKFSLLAVLATCAAPAAAEIYLKEQFNDDVSLIFVGSWASQVGGVNKKDGA